MVVDTIKDSACVNKIIGQKTEIVVVEGDTIIPDTKPDILNVINARGIPCMYKKEVLDGKVRIDGGINLYMIYLASAENNNTRGLNVVLDFTQIFDFEQAKSGMTLNENIIIKNIECKILNERKINIKVILETQLELCSSGTIEIVKELYNVENVQTLSNNIDVQSLIGMNNTKVYAKDSLNLNEVDEITDILNVNFQLINKDTKISYNKVLAKADAQFRIMYLTVDDRINIVEGTIPIMGFIEMPDIKENATSDITYELKNIIVKPNSIEEHSIYVEAEIELFCKAYEGKNIDIIQDLYSIDDELNFTSKEAQVLLSKQDFKNIYSIVEKQKVLDLEEGKICDVEVVPIITNQTILSNRIIYEGEITFKYIYTVNNTTNINIKTINIPLNFSADIENLETQTNIKTSIGIISQNFIVSSDGIVDINIDLEFITTATKMQKLTIIDEIIMETNRGNNIYSMIIYFVKPGDTLWKIAKKFRSTVEDIMRVNIIEDENQIKPGQQLFIPKYIKKRILE